MRGCERIGHYIRRRVENRGNFTNLADHGATVHTVGSFANKVQKHWNVHTCT